jgi:BolA family transcriptional regulator, general stress-responsive regulator
MRMNPSRILGSIVEMPTNPNEIRIEWIQSQLTSALEPHLLTIHDDSDKHVGHSGIQSSNAGHFSIEISAPIFAGKSLLECHRMIYAALAPAIPHEIHALKITVKRFT